ncbi:hypothetical protein D3C78_1548380 [compost metagenome]
MAFFDVALVKIEILFAETRLCGAHLQVGVAFENAFLLTIGGELPDWNARRYARIAILAMGAIQMVATAPKTHFRQVCIDMHIHGLARVEKQGRGLFLGQIAAGVGLSGIELQTRQLGHDQPSDSAFE